MGYQCNETGLNPSNCRQVYPTEHPSRTGCSECEPGDRLIAGFATSGKVPYTCQIPGAPIANCFIYHNDDDYSRLRCKVCRSNFNPNPDASACVEVPTASRIANCQYYIMENSTNIRCGFCNSGFRTNDLRTTCESTTLFPGCATVANGKCMICATDFGFWSTDVNDASG